MKQIEEIAAKNQEKTWEIIRNTNVMGIWQDAGATIKLVGSLRTRLLVKHRDIDFHIYTELHNQSCFTTNIYGFDRVLHTQFAEKVLPVNIHGMNTNTELMAYLFAQQALLYQL